MSLSIVIPCFNKFAFTRACLEDLSKTNNEIIIVDNGSSDETILLKNHPSITYIRLNSNMGFAKACNAGYKKSIYNNVLFLNNDIRVKNSHESWTNSIIELCHTGLVGPTMGQLDSNLNFIKEANEVLPGLSYMSGWCLGASKEIFDKLIINNYDGPFSEEYFVYHEDTDLSFRAKELGIKFNIVNIPVVHFGKTTSKSLNVHELYMNSRKIFVKKWEKRCLKLIGK